MRPRMSSMRHGIEDGRMALRASLRSLVMGRRAGDEKEGAGQIGIDGGVSDQISGSAHGLPPGVGQMLLLQQLVVARGTVPSDAHPVGRPHHPGHHGQPGHSAGLGDAQMLHILRVHAEAHRRQQASQHCHQTGERDSRGRSASGEVTILARQDLLFGTGQIFDELMTAA